ncbi:hypothetical protein [Microbacterium sp. RU33B]|uniref:hypothetical protein n=1 Tax=Microbacterium sp. RU33B TaxID=1907390 RepID=UPI000961A120|nr:hypothetical protein [Microbacterium sp. RU33B]SIT83269.1 flagellar assembly protein FliH [Microbacterium sp. RU33B]
MSPETFAMVSFPRIGSAADAAERARARARGYADGHAEGMRIARADAQRAAAEALALRRSADDAAAVVAASASTALDTAAVALADRVETVAFVALERVLAHAVELAETILERELADDVRSALVASLRAATAIDAGDDAAPVVVVSTRDLATLERLGAQPDGVALEGSDDLAPGDAVVRLADGDVDLRVGAALARARAALSEAP